MPYTQMTPTGLTGQGWDAMSHPFLFALNCHDKWQYLFLVNELKSIQPNILTDSNSLPRVDLHQKTEHSRMSYSGGIVSGLCYRPRYSLKQILKSAMAESLCVSCVSLTKILEGKNYDNKNGKYSLGCFCSDVVWVGYLSSDGWDGAGVCVACS